MRRFLFAILSAFLVLASAAPLSPAEARVNSGLSLGSRGSLTNAPVPGASPFQRSMSQGSYGGGYASNYGGYSRGYGMRSGFGSGFAGGLLGGLFGIGLGGLLFGGMHGGFGILGLLIRLAILFFVGRWLLRLFAGGMAPAAAGAYGARFAPGGMPGAARPGMFGGGGGSAARRPVQLAQTDYQSFDALLRNIQAAWSAHDMAGLQNMATPEMVSYFGEQLAEQTSRGVRNTVSDVRLLQGNLVQAWGEGNRDYATVSMRFSMIDATMDAAGRVVDGSLNERVTVTEFWTFVRSSGGRWILSAIQQQS